MDLMRLLRLALPLAALCQVAVAQATNLIIATEDYPPFNIKGNGERPISGISTDIVRELMKRAGITIDITMYPWQRALSIAATDSDSCVYSTVRTAKREATYKWVGPLTSDDWALFAPSSSRIALNTLEDARNYKLGGYQGDAAGDFLVSHKFRVDLAESDNSIRRSWRPGASTCGSPACVPAPSLHVAKGYRISSRC